MGLCLCTHILDDDGQLSASQSFAREVAVLRTRIQARKMPVVWLLGDGPAVGTHALNVAERFGFACLDAGRITKEEAAKDNSRGRLIRGKTAQGKRVPDRVMVDLIKERMVSSGDTRGYLLAGFPLTPKQSILFTRELALVDCVVMLQPQEVPQACSLQPTVPLSAQLPLQPSAGGGVMPEGDSKGVGDKKQGKDKVKEDEAVKEIVEATGGKWDLLVEKINANEPPSDIFLKIEAAILDRTSTNKI